MAEPMRSVLADAGQIDFDQYVNTDTAVRRHRVSVWACNCSGSNVGPLMTTDEQCSVCGSKWFEVFKER